MPGMTFEEYIEDIRSAHARGEILLSPEADLDGSQDKDSHILHGVGTSTANLGCLTGLGRSAMYALCGAKRQSHGERSWLELGAGIGRAVTEIHDHGITVDAVGLTPFAPHCKPATWLANEDFPRGRLRDLLGEEEVFKVSDRITGGTREIRREIFARVDEPIVRRQYIGSFPGFAASEEYDVIHDRCGPFYYMSGTGGKGPECLEKIQALLKKDGLFVLETSPVDEKYLEDDDALAGWKMIVTGFQQPRLLFRSGAQPWSRLLPAGAPAITRMSPEQLAQRLAELARIS